MTILIMRRKEFTETFHDLLLALAVVDTVFIVAAIFTLITKYGFY